MSAENLSIDQNGRNVLGAITNDASEFIKNLRVNPMTGRLLVDAHVTSTNTQIGDTIPGGTAGSVLFLDIGSTLAQDNSNFFYDSTNHRLGLGTTSPAKTLHVAGTFRYVDGSQGTGYIMTGNSSGDATWLATLSISHGGTGQTTANSALNALLPSQATHSGGVLTTDGTNTSWITSGGTGTVTSVSVVTANGFAGSVATSTTTPAITLSTTITGILTGNGTAISAASTTGSGAVVLANTPTLITPVIGAATGTSLNLSGLTASSAVATDGSKNLVSITNTGSGNNVLATSPTLVTPALGTPSALVLTNATGLPVAGGGTGVASLTAYAPLFGGTTTTGAIQSGTVGTSGQVLTSNGAGAIATFQNPTGAGAWSLVSTVTPSSVSLTSGVETKVVEFTGLTGDTDDEYLIEYELAIDTGTVGGTNTNLLFRLNNDSGAFEYSWNLTNGGGAGSTQDTAIRMVTGSSNVELESFFGEIRIKASKTIAGTTRLVFSTASGNIHNIGGGAYFQHSAGAWADTTNQITSLQIYYIQTTGSTRAISGKASLYKINR